MYIYVIYSTYKKEKKKEVLMEYITYLLVPQFSLLSFDNFSRILRNKLTKVYILTEL